MRSQSIAIGFVVLLSGAAIHAQEDAGVGEAEGEAAAAGDEWVVEIEDEPAPVAPAGAPAAAQDVKAHPLIVPAVVKLTPSDVIKLDPDLYPRRERNLIISKQRKIKQLGDIMAREGPEYDPGKDAGYVAMIANGAVIVAGGAASLVFSFYHAIGAFGAGMGCGHDGCDEEDVAREEDYHRTRAWVLLSIGLGGGTIGALLIVAGAKGKKRQKWLRKKDEILDMSPLNGISLTVYPTRDGISGGLMMSGGF
jgi:hypothetical protein